MHASQVLATAFRFHALTRGGLQWLSLFPLIMAEVWILQLLADGIEKRPLKMLPREGARNCLRVAIFEAIELMAVIRFFGIPAEDPTFMEVASAVYHGMWRAPLFDLVLDSAFYLFHRSCHINKALFKHCHGHHHTHTGKDEGHLVAWETYTIDPVENIGIVLCHCLALCALRACGPLSALDLAIFITWAHVIEMIGHTGMSWTPGPHPWRLLPMIAGIELTVREHEWHHTRPMKNYGKRFNLCDRFFGTYRRES